MYGTITAKVKGYNYIGEIVSLQDVGFEGKDIPATRECPAEHKLITYELGIAEFYGLGDTSQIDDLEILDLYWDDESFDYTPEVEIQKIYYDFNSGCLVVEFK